MVLEEITSRIQWLEGQLRSFISSRQKAETEREDCARGIDALRKVRNDEEEDLYNLYQGLMRQSDQMRGSKFKRIYQARLKEILYSRDTYTQFEKLDESVREAQNAYQKADESVNWFIQKIREIEAELSHVRTEMIRQQEEQKNGSK